MAKLPSTLDEIIAYKKMQVSQQQVLTPRQGLRALAGMQPRPEDVSSHIREHRPTLIARITNPTTAAAAGTPPRAYDPVALARRLVRQGAHGVVVTTDQRYHGGAVEDLMLISRAVDVPVIRDDYILDQYQVVETRAAGGDGLVLDIALLDDLLVRSLISVTQRNLMTSLVHVYNESDLNIVLKHEPRVIVLNNYDPRTGETDLSVTRRLRRHVPAHISTLSAGGLHTPDDILRVISDVEGVIVPQEMLLLPDTASVVRKLLGLSIAVSDVDSEIPSTW